jgi:hypothetical protein
MRLHLLTGVHQNLTEHLEATNRSVAELQDALRSRGVDVQWHVVMDGPGGPYEPPAAATSFHRAGRDIGVSACRNLALSATGGEGWVFRLDGDDEVDIPGWVALVDDPSFGAAEWHPTNLTDQHGQPTVHWFDQVRWWKPREVEESWTSPMPFHPNNVVVRTELALAVGGWPALRVNEDILWCFSLNDTTPCLALPHITLRYRRWEHQVVADANYLTDKQTAFALIAAVTNARRTRSGLDPITPPTAGAGALYLPPS